MPRLMIVSLVAVFLGTCSAATKAASPAGRWRGEWSSQTSGHRGPMKARIRPLDGDRYRAVFVGRFAAVVPFVYPATLQRVPGTSNVYTSSQRLPLMGTYRMTATVSSRSFRASFQGRRDRGTFRMRR